MKSRGLIETEVLGSKTFKEYCDTYSYEHFKEEVNARLFQEQINAIAEIVKSTQENGLKIGEALSKIAQIISK